MHARPQPTVHAKPDRFHIDAAMVQTLRLRGCTLGQIAYAAALWREFVADLGPEGMSGSATSWYAALHYLVAAVAGASLTRREVATRYHISPSTLAARVKQLAGYVRQPALPSKSPVPDRRRYQWFREQRDPPPDRSAVLALVTAARKLLPATKVAALDDDAWIAIFGDTHRLVSTLYCERSHLEIGLYLSHVEVHLLLGGYRIEPSAIAGQFGKLFARLGLQAVKGRDVRKFVYLQDIFGRQEPFALLELESQHG
jgi:hypothetical protein